MGRAARLDDMVEHEGDRRYGGGGEQFNLEQNRGRYIGVVPEAKQPGLEHVARLGACKRSGGDEVNGQWSGILSFSDTPVLCDMMSVPATGRQEAD